ARLRHGGASEGRGATSRSQQVEPARRAVTALERTAWPRDPAEAVQVGQQQSAPREPLLERPARPRAVVPGAIDDPVVVLAARRRCPAQALLDDDATLADLGAAHPAGADLEAPGREPRLDHRADGRSRAVAVHVPVRPQAPKKPPAV